MYYWEIAKQAYSTQGIERAFFPLYSAICGILSKLTSIPVFWVGLILSIGSFAGSGLVLFKLVLHDSGHHAALFSVLWLCISPMAFFFISFYPESLFLLFALGSIFFARKGAFLKGGLCIMLAGATTPVAVLLAIPYLAEYFYQRPHTSKQNIQFIVGAFIAPLGLLSYMFYLGRLAGTVNGFHVFTTLQATEWGRTRTFPWITLFHGIQAAIWGTSVTSLYFSRLLAIQNLGYALIGISIAAWGWFNLRRSFSFYLIGGVLFLLINHGPAGNPLMSFPRHLAILFPVYIALSNLFGKFGNPMRVVLVGLSVILLVLYTAWFTSGRWVA